MTVKRRIALLVTGAGFMASLLFSVAIFFELVEQPFQILDMELEEEALRVANIVAARMRSGVSTQDQSATDAIYHFWLRVRERGSGKLLCQTPLAAAVDLAPLEIGKSATVGLMLPTDFSSQGQERRTRTTFRLKTFAFDVDGNGFVVQIARPMNKLQDEIWDLVYSLVAGLILSGLMLIAISHFIAGKILQPIGKMKDMARDISERKLDQRLPVGPEKDEFNELARTINRMLDRLQHSFENQRNFLFDTSHELKTPLTTMRLAVEEICATDIEKISGSTSENLLRLKTQVRRMDRLIRDLLNLSALEMADAIEKTPLSVAAIITPLVDEYRFLAEAQHIHIDCRLPESCVVIGEAEKLTRAFSNIIDNAVKYNTEGGAITIEGEQADGWVTISVANTGPGVPEAALDKVFDQFFRVEKSRSVEFGGSGLGLAIVKRIITLHGGDIRMESRPGDWTRVRVSLPLNANGKNRGGEGYP